MSNMVMQTCGVEPQGALVLCPGNSGLPHRRVGASNAREQSCSACDQVPSAITTRLHRKSSPHTDPTMPGSSHM